jgi:hypothetical protein
MEAHDILKKAAIFNQDLTEQEIASLFSKVENQISAGRLYPDKFHLMAGPYLNDISEHAAQLVWETDRASKAILTYGEKLPLEMSKNFDSGEEFIQTVSLENLKPGTTYFYKLDWNLKAEKNYPLRFFLSKQQSQKAIRFCLESSAIQKAGLRSITKWPNDFGKKGLIF